MAAGFGLYEYPSGACRKAFPVSDREPALILPIIFIHNGQSVLLGSIDGELCLHSCIDGHIDKLHLKGRFIY